MEATQFKKFVLDNAEQWVVKRPLPQTVQNNRRAGIVYDYPMTYAIPVNVLINQDFSTFADVYEDEIKKYYVKS